MRLYGRPASRNTAAIFFRFWKYIYRNALLLEEYVDIDFTFTVFCMFFGKLNYYKKNHWRRVCCLLVCV